MSRCTRGMWGVYVYHRVPECFVACTGVCLYTRVSVHGVCACGYRCVHCCEHACVVASHGTCDAHTDAGYSWCRRSSWALRRTVPPHRQALSFPLFLPFSLLSPAHWQPSAPHSSHRLGRCLPLIPSSPLMPFLNPLAKVSGFGQGK